MNDGGFGLRKLTGSPLKEKDYRSYIETLHGTSRDEVLTGINGSSFSYVNYIQGQAKESDSIGLNMIH